ncbi:mucin-5AC-like [Ostrea edulis]|uniref:mucin-5AC-like n=1 Tax=Ostrea edulis TaxID=37623 RepID=UPI0024AF6336|nr:mucin-5AC-like [Ostrea edulis]
MKVLFLVSLFSLSWAFPSPSRKQKLQDSLKQELVPIQIILDQNHARIRRSANSFPDKILFKFSTSGGDFRLDLARNDLVKVPPVLLWTGERVMNDTTFDLQRDFALYQGSAMGANALVRFPNNDFTRFELHANYIIGTEFYSIEPVTSRTRRSAIKIVEPPFSRTTPHPATIRIHNVLRLEKDSLDFENDMFIIKSDPSQTEELKLQRVVEDTSGEHNTGPFVTDFGTIHDSGGRRRRQTNFMKENNRYRRNTNQLYVEYLVCVDYANFIIWKSMSNSTHEEQRNEDAKNALTRYYLYLANGIDTRFKTAQTPQGDLRVAIAGIVLAMDRMSSNWTENNVISGNKVNDGNTLMDFAIWSNSQKSRLPRHDHTALYTGYNLAETATDDRTIGIAYLSRVCNSYAASVNEETFNAIAIHIGSHELGHSIGASHDTGACPSRNFNLMAGILPNPANLSPDMALNTYKFSACSRVAIGNYVSGLLENCLSNIPPYLDVVSRESQAFTADEQCAMTYAPSTGSTVCRETYLGTILKWSEICHKLRCRIPGSTSCSAHFTFDGTPCGNYKWCQQGQCVSSMKAQDVPDICPIGDDPSYNCDVSLCNQYSPSVREGNCCQTCLIGTTTTSAPTTTTTPLTTTTPTTTMMPTTTKTAKTSTTPMTTTTSKTTTTTTPTMTSSTTTTTPTTSITPTTLMTTTTPTTSITPTTLMTTTTPTTSITPTTLMTTTTTPTTSITPTTLMTTTTTPTTSITPTTLMTTTTTPTTSITPTTLMTTTTTPKTTITTPTTTTTLKTTTAPTTDITTATPKITTSSTTRPTTKTSSITTTATTSTITTRMMTTLTTMTMTTAPTITPINITRLTTLTPTSTAIPTTSTTLTMSTPTTPTTTTPKITKSITTTMTSTTRKMTSGISTTTTLPATANTRTTTTLHSSMQPKKTSATYSATVTPSTAETTTSSISATTTLPITSSTKVQLPTSVSSPNSISTKAPQVTTSTTRSGASTTKIAVPISTFESTTAKSSPPTSSSTTIKSTTAINPQTTSVELQSSSLPSTESTTPLAPTNRSTTSAKSTTVATIVTTKQSTLATSSSTSPSTTLETTTALPESSTSKTIHSSTSLSTTNALSHTTTNSFIDSKETTKSMKTTNQPSVKTTTDSSDDDVIINFMQQANFYHLTKIALFQALVANL